MRFNRLVVGTHLAVSVLLIILLIGSLPEMISAGTHLKSDTVAPHPLRLKITLVRTYLDGEASEEVLYENVSSFETLMEKYDQWQLKDINPSAVVLTKQMDDISPLLKANGYFGITENGVLTIFNGKPGRLNIIQSFFQIDTKKLETKKHEELIRGIPVKTKDHFVEVLETFKPYSMQHKQTR